jgi:hypothetical protein
MQVLDSGMRVSDSKLREVEATGWQSADDQSADETNLLTAGLSGCRSRKRPTVRIANPTTQVGK